VAGTYLTLARQSHTTSTNHPSPITHPIHSSPHLIIPHRSSHRTPFQATPSRTRPSKPRHPRGSHIPPQPAPFRFHTDLPRLVPELRTFKTGSRHPDHTLFQTLGRPVRGRDATAPDANAGLLGELRVVEQVDPQGQDDLGDAGAVDVLAMADIRSDWGWMV